MSPFKKFVPLLLLPPLFPLVAALGACSSAKPGFQDDQLFSSTASPYSRNFDSPPTDACEAARRGLLSQGYMTTMTRSDAVDATKDFQPAPDSHVDVEIHVVCTAADASNTSVVYVNAVQNGYALKKSDTSASVGLSVFGSLSLPIRTNNDAMVKISSQTIQSGAFYDKFFDLVDHYLRATARTQPVPHGSIEITPLPPPVSPSPPVAVVTPPATPATAVAGRPVAPVSGAASAVASGGSRANATVAAGAAADSAPGDAHAAAPVTAAATGTNATAKAGSPAAETTALVKPATAAATDAAAAALPGIGEPPILPEPVNYELATATVTASPRAVALQPVAVPATMPQTAPAPGSASSASNSPTSATHAAAAAAPVAPASGATTSAPAAAAPVASSTPATATPVASRTPARAGRRGKPLGANGETGCATVFAVFFAFAMPSIPENRGDILKIPRFDKRVARSYVSAAAAHPDLAVFTTIPVGF